MINIRKAAAFFTIYVFISSTFFGCTPTIGNNSKSSMTIDGLNVPAGIFIYYTLKGYDEASNILKDKNGVTLTPKDIRNANIDSINSADWIQNKATKYCAQFALISKEFEAIKEDKLEDIDIDDLSSQAEYIYFSDKRLAANSISLDTVKLIYENAYKKKEVFKYYYGFDGIEGCSEDELKDYFNDNFARVKYVTISLNDSDGNRVVEDEIRKRRKMADEFADEINSKSNEQDKLNAVNDAIIKYNDYIATQTSTTETDDSDVTTPPAAGIHDNEKLIQKEKNTETAEDNDSTENEKNQKKFNKYVFNQLQLNKAEVYDFDPDTIYVVIRADLRERMTADDYWSKEYIIKIQSIRYYDSFEEMIDVKSNALTIQKNKVAFRRYAPFKLDLGK